jgi:hypothetical protein
MVDVVPENQSFRFHSARAELGSSNLLLDIAINGERQIYVLNPDDPHGLAPLLRQFIAEEVAAGRLVILPPEV